jgi:hypothetical protein
MRQGDDVGRRKERCRRPKARERRREGGNWQELKGT